jgi:DNA-binding MarR family transcriptional regulator
MVAALEEDGLVQRVTKPGQGRATFVEFTEAGREAHAQTKRIGAAFAEKFHANLSDEELDALQAGMQRLFANLTEIHEDPGAILQRAESIELDPTTEQPAR